DSLLHRLDARAKFISLVLIIVAVFVVNSFWGYLVLAALIFSLLLTSQLPLRYFFRGLRPVYYIMIFTLIIHFFFTKGGTELLRLGPASIDTYGVYLGFFMVVRIIFLVVSTSLLTLTTSPI